MLVVLVIVAMLCLAAYSFSDRMLTEYEVAHLRISRFQQSADTYSGVAMVRSLSNEHGANSAWQHSLKSADWILQRNQRLYEEAGNVHVLPCLLFGDETPKHGVADESAKLNVNSLDLRLQRREESVQRLLAIPGMNRGVAEAILDWIDADDEATDFGAESKHYSGSHSGAVPKQGPVASLTELLQVRGVDAEKLFGEDANANGVLDPNEDDGALRFPHDNQDGQLDQGWSKYLTVLSREPGRSPTSTSWINLNSDDLESLYSQLEDSHDAAVARFVVAWRIAGSTAGVESQRIVRGSQKREEALARLEKQRSASRLLNSLADLKRRTGVSRKLRDGLDLSLGAAYRLNSVIDLVDVQVRINVNGKDTLLRSPWGGSAEQISEYLDGPAKTWIVGARELYSSRVSLHSASETVLRTVPEITGPELTAFRFAQRQLVNHPDLAERRGNLSWLIAEKVVDLRGLRRLAPYVCCGGSVVSGFSIARSQTSHAIVATKFIIDSSGDAPLVLEHREYINPSVDERLRRVLEQGAIIP